MKPNVQPRLLALLAGLALAAFAARADDPSNPPAPPAAPPPANSPSEGGETPPPPHPGRRMGPGYSLEELTDKLGLTADQQKKVGAIINAGRSQARAIRNDETLSREDRREQMRQVMQSTRAQIRAALTADQQKEFDALPPPHGGRPRGPDSN